MSGTCSNTSNAVTRSKAAELAGADLAVDERVVGARVPALVAQRRAQHARAAAVVDVVGRALANSCSSSAAFASGRARL
jgi:hypothetical protein